MSKAKYIRGAPIRSLDELVKQDFVYWNDKITHFGWFLGWQLRMTNNAIHRDNPIIFYAIKRVEE